MDYQKINSETISRWCREGWEWGQPITHEAYINATKGQWGVYLTPTKFVPHSWFGDLTGKKVLGLASGGGQQMPVFAALGAQCTVLDYSQEQCNSEKMVAAREGYAIEILQADMTKPLPFNPLKDPALYAASMENDWGIQFSHTLQEQIGGQLKAGFTLTDLYEDTNGSGRLHQMNVPSFVATRCIK